ncbi:unnamed protein product [Brassica oleracea]
MSDRENPEKGDEEAKETDTRRESTSIEETEENEPERHGLSEYPVRIGVEDCYYYLKNSSHRYSEKPQEEEETFEDHIEDQPYVKPPPFDIRILTPDQRVERMKEDEYPVRPGEKDCSFYLKTGRCDFGEFCRFNHPKVRNNIIYLAYSKLKKVTDCFFYMQFVQFFLGGKCKYGSTCKFKHSKEGDSTEAMRQVIAYKLLYYSDQPNVKNLTESLLQDQKRQRTESSYENRNVNAQENLQQQADTERQNREAQEKAQEERRRQIDNERRQARLRLERGQTPDMRPSGSGTRSVEKAVVRYDRDTRFRDENMEATPDRDPIAHAIYWEKKVQELRVRNAEMKQRRANETIQKQRLRNAEMQQRRADKTESRSIEETKGETVDMRPSGSGEKAVVRYDRDTRFWEDKMQQKRLSDALMQHMRSNEIVSRSTDETKVHGFTYSQGKRGQTRPSGSGRWSPVVRYTRSWEENREYLESSGRENEAVQIRDQNETYIQQRQRDDEMQQRRSRETESIFFQQQKNRAEAPDLGYKRRRFDERRHKQEQYPTRPRIKRGVCHFYLKKGWCGYGRDCVFNHPTPSWRFDERRHDTEVPEKMFRVWFRRFLWTIMIIRLEQCMGGGGGGWLSYDERRRNPATREILMPPPRRMEQRDREREVRNEGAS